MGEGAPGDLRGGVERGAGAPGAGAGVGRAVQETEGLQAQRPAHSGVLQGTK